MTLYRNCRELPIHNFFEINRTNDLSYLVKSGIPPADQILQDRYLEIADEYNALFSSKKKGGSIAKSKLHVLQLKLMNLEIIEMVLKRSGITDEIKAIAKKLRIKPEMLSSYISGVQNDLRRLQKEMKDEEEKGGKSNDNNSDSLEKTLTLVKENGFNFDRFSTPIIEFVYAINRLEEKAKQNQSSNKK